ncbi:NPCBM/NEW2 domain-containing protein [Deinococcus oregonensis]|uniref:NPCBM/NEW2 domain-containing protein n=1 Tax=Deinococcus oregonensis TaxID=1805970 RepID=A0ABV6B2A2_9DEIO
MTATENTLQFEPLLAVTNGWGPIELSRSNGEQAAGDGRPLTLNGVVYHQGFGVHAGSELRFSLQGANGAECTRFTAALGLDDEVGTQGSVVFQIFLDGVRKYDSGRLTGASPTQQLNLNVTGSQELRLVVTDAGDGRRSDHADWADPKVLCQPSGRLINYDFEFSPDTIEVYKDTTATANLVVSDLGTQDNGLPSGPVSFKVKIFNTSSPLEITLAEPDKTYAATTFPAQFPVRFNLSTSTPGSLQRIELLPVLEDVNAFYGYSRRFDLYWRVLPQ